MNDSIKRISLDLHATSSRETVKVKRGDTGRKIYVSLVDGGVPYHISEGCYAVFTGKKPDGNILFNDCTIEGNVIAYKLTEQTAAVPGLVNCEIKLYGADDQLITSPKFSIMVDDTVYNEGDEIESEGEVEALTALISDATEAISGANTAASNANQVAQELQEARENGEFKGEPGEPGPQGPKGDPGSGGGSSPLTVTIDGDKASHTSAEIYAHVQSGGTAVLNRGEVVGIPYRGGDESEAVFIWAFVEASFFLCTSISNDGTVSTTQVTFADGTALRQKITSPTTAKVGQTIIVKFRDNTGKPTAWECADLPSDDHINSLIDEKLGVIENGSY